MDKKADLELARENFHAVLYSAIRATSLDVADVLDEPRSSTAVCKVVGGWLVDFLKGEKRED